MIKRLLFAVGLAGLCLLAAPQSVAATDILQGVDCSQAPDSAVCHSKVARDPRTHELINPIGGRHGLLAGITDIVSFVAGAAAIIVIIVAGLRYVTSGSDISTSSRTDTDVENAKRTIANAVIGLVVIVLARTLILFVLKKI